MSLSATPTLLRLTITVWLMLAIALGGMMLTGTIGHRERLHEQIKELSILKDMQVIHGASVSSQYGDGGHPTPVLDSAVDSTHRVAEGDLSVHIKLQSKDKGSLLLAMQAMIDNLTHIIGDVASASDKLSNAAEVRKLAGRTGKLLMEVVPSIRQTSALVQEPQQIMTFFQLENRQQKPTA